MMIFLRQRNSLPKILLFLLIAAATTSSFLFPSLFPHNTIFPRSRHHHRHEPRRIFTSTLQPSQRSSTTPSCLILHAASPSQFQVGEEVVVLDEDGDTTTQSTNVGLVEQKKGGWYTICLKNNGARIKRRGSRLRKRSEVDDDGSKSGVDAQPPTIRRMGSPTTEEPSSIDTAADIVDLDSILQSIHQKYHPTVQSGDKYNVNGNNSTNQTLSTSEETIQQITHCHSKVTQWLIFSDLHVMPSTLSTCLEVLDKIHEIALQRNQRQHHPITSQSSSSSNNTGINTGTNTGILFLGDFWHHRNYVRIDCLNAILKEMSKWTVPCIMIPGNHDQVDWRGVEHALTPLANSYFVRPPPSVGSSGGGGGGGTNKDGKLNNPLTVGNDNVHDGNDEKDGKWYPGPLILTNPTKFLNALFVPHTRDKTTMKTLLSSSAAISSSALFVHADVKGAYMNDLIQSRHGLGVESFPQDKRVYSGHFHKPHTVVKNIGNKKKGGGDGSSGGSIKIRYVGSPYQTSFAEAGQIKSLLVVDALKDWECVEEIPIYVGPRYHRISSVHDFLDSRLDSGREDSSGLKQFRKGDKVAVTVCQRELEEMRILAAQKDKDANDIDGRQGKSQFDIKLKELRSAGISVEIRDDNPSREDERLIEDRKSLSTTSDDNEAAIELEDLSPEATLAAYLEEEMKNGGMGNATAKVLLEKGQEVLLLLQGSNDISQSSPISQHQEKAMVSELELESVSLLGFGSFRKEVAYPLKDRGVVLLRGTNKDFGSDSNGVGKTTLAMASLWALAGSTDPRPTQDGKVTDVINDFSKIAEVTLRGTINSKPFVVKRTKASRTSSLTFVLDGKDMTRQSSKDTQALINEYFSIDSGQMLTRTIFHGQHAMGGLLESSDAKLKEELSQLVSLEVWQRSASLARAKQRELMRKASELEGMLSLRTNDRARAEGKMKAAKEEMSRRDKMVENERRTLLDQEHGLSDYSDVTDIEKKMNEVQIRLDKCNAETNGLEDELAKFMSSDNHNITELRSKLNEKLAIENEARRNLQSCQRKHDVAQMELKSAEKQLSLLHSEWDISTNDDANGISSSSISSPPETCPTCCQPIVSHAAQTHVRENMEKKLTAASSNSEKAKVLVSATLRVRVEAEEELEAKDSEVQLCMKKIRNAEEKLSQEADCIRHKIQESRITQSKLSAEFASLARKAKEISEFQLVKSRAEANLNRLTEALNSSLASYQSCCSDLEMIEKNIADLNMEKEKMTSEASIYTALADTFGPKGVQAFVLHNIVQALQYYSRAYLDELSDGSLQLSMQVGSNDSILKQAAIRDLDGTWRVRPLSSLSGGQWRRCSLSLSLGFIVLASKRGRLRSSLMVLDEPLTHLDSAGRKSVGKLLRKMLANQEEELSGIGKSRPRYVGGLGLSTILVILQEIAAEEIEECFDEFDEVVKYGGESYVVLDENQEE